MEPNFEVLHTIKIKEIKELREAYIKKRELEKKIAILIREFEDDTGLAVDLIKYQRDLTLPIRRNYYIALSVKLTHEELENW